MKNILVLLTFMLFSLSSYCEIPNVSDKIMETKVKIGYDENHFSPLKPQAETESWLVKYTKFSEALHIEGDSIKFNKVKKEKPKERDVVDDFLLGILLAIFFYIIVACVLFLILTTLGCGLLMIAKTIQIYRKKSK